MVRDTAVAPDGQRTEVWRAETEHEIADVHAASMIRAGHAVEVVKAPPADTKIVTVSEHKDEKGKSK
jgi:hypothetical protein